MRNSKKAGSLNSCECEEKKEREKERARECKREKDRCIVCVLKLFVEFAKYLNL